MPLTAISSAPTLSSFHRALISEATWEIVSGVCALYGRLFIRNVRGLRAPRQHNQGGVCGAVDLLFPCAACCSLQKS